MTCSFEKVSKVSKVNLGIAFEVDRISHQSLAVAPLAVLPILSSQKAPIDKVPVLPEQNQEKIIDELDKDDVIALMDDKEEDKKEEEAKVVENDQV
nr:hypothetical protein [Tanacetum cinerariifolium]